MNFLNSFEDFLTETDYVSNQFSNFYGSFGIIWNSTKLKGNHKTNKGNFGFGYSFTTLASFDYRYEEEVRYETSFEDGESGNKDPLLGFHVYSNEGHLQLASVGLGYSFSNNNSNNQSVAIGFSINHILGSSISDYAHIDTAFYSVNTEYYNNLSAIKDHKATYNTLSKSYKSYSLELPLTAYSKQSAIILAGETEALLETTNYSSYDLSPLSSLPWFLEYNDLTNQYEFILEGVQYYKPKKFTFGLRLKKYRTLIVFETVEQMYSEFNPYFNDVSEYKIAFEHKFRMGSDIRMGLSYKEPLVNSLFGPISIFTLGSNRKISKRLNADFAISYYITDYNYDDIFRTSNTSYNDCAEHCEKITESNISISTTFKWNF
mgnify:FL=1